MCASERLPWEVVETFPSTDATLVATWNDRLDAAVSTTDRARALIGRSLASYWSVQEGVGEGEESACPRTGDLVEALSLARDLDIPDLVAEALLGVLYATWGPDTQPDRALIVSELADLRELVVDEEIRLRILEWVVLEHLDHAELDSANTVIERFAAEAADTELVLFRRREILWRACVAMLEGRIDESLQANQDAISSTADTAGSPFSFQNVAITLAIERYFRRGLADVIGAIRSIRASSPRVAPNWDTGLAFALSEAGDLPEAAELFADLAPDEFAVVPRDLNWLVTMQLLGLVALTLDDRERGQILLNALRPFAHLDATHGSGYASYGPVARVVAALAARLGDQEEAEVWFDHVFTTRPAGPWTSLTLLDRAVSRRAADPAGALSDAATAAEQLRSFELEGWAADATALVEELRLGGHGDPIARLQSGSWTFRHPSGSADVAESVGATHLVQLLARPGEVIDVLELDAITDPSLPKQAVVESTLDREARSAYQERIDEIESSARTTSGTEEELSYLRRELSGAAHQVSNSAELERARVRVTKAIRRAIDDIADQSAGLGQYLRSTIDTGRRCLYHPADGAAWLVVRNAG